MNRRNFLRALRASTAIAVTVFAVGTASAEALRDQWCKDVKIRFFVGGAEGDGFGVIVYNGAVQAAHDTGAQVEYVKGMNKNDQLQKLLEKSLFFHEKNVVLSREAGLDTVWVDASEVRAKELRGLIARRAAGELFQPGTVPGGATPGGDEGAAPRATAAGDTDYVPGRQEL